MHEGAGYVLFGIALRMALAASFDWLIRFDTIKTLYGKANYSSHRIELMVQICNGL